MKRRTAALLALAGLLVLSGCLGGGGISQQALNRNVTYDWSTDANVTVRVEATEYHAVYVLANQSRLELSQSTEFTGQQPVPVEGVKFRYPNGTIVDASAINVTQSGSTTVIVLPADEGKFAYTSPSGTRSLQFPVTIEGSHEVVLPAGMRVSVPLFGSVEPGGYERTYNETTNRVHLYWESVDADTITVDYYLQRDLYIFAGIVVLGIVAAIGGVAYYRRRIRRLERRREESGLDVEDE